jgi:hypothetical protein
MTGGELAVSDPPLPVTAVGFAVIGTGVNTAYLDRAVGSNTLRRRLNQTHVPQAQ